MSKLLENMRVDRFVRFRIVTCDEKWIYFNNRDKQRKQRLNCGASIGTGGKTRSVLAEGSIIVHLVELRRRHTF